MLCRHAQDKIGDRCGPRLGLGQNHELERDVGQVTGGIGEDGYNSASVSGWKLAIFDNL
jgi:hypothetical protein